jgi:hypothetical protein
MLLQKGTWDKLASYRYDGKQYVFLYMLRHSEKLMEMAEKTAKECGLPLVIISDYYVQNNDFLQTTDAGVEDFLSAIKNADYIITNSFHGTVFSTMFRKKFASEIIERTGSRARDYLNDMNLADRVIREYKPEEVFGEIDYKTAEIMQTKLKTEAIRYISNIVRQALIADGYSVSNS